MRVDGSEKPLRVRFDFLDEVVDGRAGLVDHGLDRCFLKEWKGRRRRRLGLNSFFFSSAKVCRSQPQRCGFFLDFQAFFCPFSLQKQNGCIKCFSVKSCELERQAERGEDGEPRLPGFDRPLFLMLAAAIDRSTRSLSLSLSRSLAQRLCLRTGEHLRLHSFNAVHTEKQNRKKEGERS